MGYYNENKVVLERTAMDILRLAVRVPGCARAAAFSHG